MNRTAALFIIALTAATAIADTTTFTNGVTCDVPDKAGAGKCTGGIGVSGDRVATITIEKIPTDPGATATLRIDAGIWHVAPVSIDGLASVQIPVYTKRAIAPQYASDRPNDSNNPPFTTILGPIPNEVIVQIDYQPAPAKKQPCPADCANAAGEDAGNKGTPKTWEFHIPVQFEAWKADSGGFYSYLWARDQEITKIDAVPADSKSTQVLIRKHGDRIGPVTGLITNFSATNYPLLGVEFGASIDKDRGTTLILGGTLRLQTSGEKALFSIGGGFGLTRVHLYPDLQENVNYSASDPRLQGVMHSRIAPYISVGLAASIGGSK